MKKLIFISISALVLIPAMNFYSCRNSTGVSKKSNGKAEMNTSVFEADFIGNYIYSGPDTIQFPKCTDSLPYRVIVDCKGTSNIMGDIDAHFDFCVNERGYYGNVSSYLVDNNNDTLFISCEGQVIDGRTEGHPSFVTSYWKDDFKILGGTGKYAGATGEGITDDYNSSQDPNSHHRWKGDIKLRNVE